MILGERMTDEEVDQILKYTDTQEDLDGNIKYEGEDPEFQIILKLTHKSRFLHG